MSETEVEFRLRARRGVRRVLLSQDLIRRQGFQLRRERGVWRLRFPRLEVDRMEYRFEVDGVATCDPGNPLRVESPFGARSVIEFPGYRRPPWLRRRELEPGGGRGPLLVVHDGPDYVRYASLLRFLRTVPPVRVALLASPDRNEEYSASAAYGRRLVRSLPAGPRIGVGASLGALALLHVQRTWPGSFAALFLQSGSYFRRRTDPQEAGFRRFGRIERFVGSVLRGERAEPIPVTMTCGRVEENLANNRAVCDALAAQGYEVRLHENRDAHNWVSWRDTFEPHLRELIEAVA